MTGVFWLGVNGGFFPSLLHKYIETIKGQIRVIKQTDRDR